MVEAIQYLTTTAPPQPFCSARVDSDSLDSHTHTLAPSPPRLDNECLARSQLFRVLFGGKKLKQAFKNLFLGMLVAASQRGRGNGLLLIGAEPTILQKWRKTQITVRLFFKAGASKTIQSTLNTHVTSVVH